MSAHVDDGDDFVVHPDQPRDHCDDCGGNPRPGTAGRWVRLRRTLGRPRLDRHMTVHIVMPARRPAVPVTTLLTS